MLSHDLEPNLIYGEVSRIGAELKKVGPRLVNFRPKNDVALLFSVDSHHGIEFMPFDRQVNYLWVLQQLCRALYQLNVGVDFVFPQSENLAEYKVIMAPPLYIASDELLNRLSNYVRQGGHLVVAFKSGFATNIRPFAGLACPAPCARPPVSVTRSFRP